MGELTLLLGLRRRDNVLGVDVDTRDVGPPSTIPCGKHGLPGHALRDLHAAISLLCGSPLNVCYLYTNTDANYAANEVCVTTNSEEI